MLGGDQLTYVSSAILQVTLYPSRKVCTKRVNAMHAEHVPQHMQSIMHEGHEHTESMHPPPMEFYYLLYLLARIRHCNNTAAFIVRHCVPLGHYQIPMYLKTAVYIIAGYTLHLSSS